MVRFANFAPRADPEDEQMSERDAYEPGVPCWVTSLQPDVEAAAAFYAALFGWETEPANGYRVARLRGRPVAAIAPLPPGVDPAPPPAWITHVSVADAVATAEAATGAGGTLLARVDEPAGRSVVVADPAGAAVCLWQPGERQGAELVNEPGAWSMSRLDTPDPEAAAAFYGALFGWTTETFDLGETSFTMFRLPGYVGGEPEQPVSREVVATMAPAETGAARWGVDFWVDDVDAATAAAERAGGRAVVAPFDIPIGRTAVLADPAGAVFSISCVGPRAG
jgi:predicted enzyme related to lactoylglutathione lyase